MPISVVVSLLMIIDYMNVKFHVCKNKDQIGAKEKVLITGFHETNRSSVYSCFQVTYLFVKVIVLSYPIMDITQISLFYEYN